MLHAHCPAWQSRGLIVCSRKAHSNHQRRLGGMKGIIFRTQYSEGYSPEDYREWIWFCVDGKIHIMRGREFSRGELREEWHGETTACDGSCVTAMEIELTQEEQAFAHKFVL